MNIYESNSSLIYYLSKFEERSNKPQSFCKYGWELFRSAIYESLFTSPANFSLLQQHEVEQIDVDRLNNLSEKHFLNIPIEYLTNEQIASLGYVQLDWLIKTNQVHTLIAHLPLTKLFYVLIKDSQPQKIFKKLPSSSLEQLLKLGEAAPLLQAQSKITEIFLRLTTNQANRFWKIHFFQSQFKLLHFVMLQVLNQGRISTELFQSVPLESLIELFKEDDQTLKDFLSIPQILSLVEESNKIGADKKLKKSILNLLTSLPREKLEIILSENSSDTLLCILPQIANRRDVDSLLKELHYSTIEDIFLKSIRSSNKRRIIAGIVVFKACQDERMLHKLVQILVENHYKIPQLFFSYFANALPEISIKHLDIIKKIATPEFFVELADRLAAQHSLFLATFFREFIVNESPYVNYLFTHAHPITQSVLFTSMLRTNDTYLLFGLLDRLGSPVEVLLEIPPLSADQMRLIAWRDKDTKLELKNIFVDLFESADAVVYKNNSNIMKAAAFLMPQLSKQNLLLAACMLSPEEISKRIKAYSKPKFLLKIVENILEENNSFWFGQIEMLFKGMNKSHNELLQKYIKHNKKALNLDFFVSAVLFFPKTMQGTILCAIESHVGVDVFPKLLKKALLLNQKNDDSLNHFIQFLIDKSYDINEILPNFDSHEEKIIFSTSSQKTLRFIFTLIKNTMNHLLDQVENIHEKLESIESIKNNTDTPIDKEKKMQTLYSDIYKIYNPLNFIVGIQKILNSEENKKLASTSFLGFIFDFFNTNNTKLFELIQKFIKVFKKNIVQPENKLLPEVCLEAYMSLQKEKFEDDVWSFFGNRGVDLTNNQIKFEKELYVKNYYFFGEMGIETVADLIRLRLYSSDIKQILNNLKAIEEKKLL